MDPQERRVCFSQLRRNEELPDADVARVEPLSEEDSDGSQLNNKAPLLTNHFTILKEVVILILSVFYVVDLGLDIWVAVGFFATKQPMNAWFVVFCILLPNLYAGYKSLQWYLRAHDLDPIREPILWIIRVSFFPVSLLLRYYDTREFGRGSRQARRCCDRKEERRLFSAFLIEAAEASMLRLYTIFLEDAPIAILNLKEIILTSMTVPQNEMRMLLVVLFKLIFTMTFSVLHYITSTKAVYHAAKSEQYILMGSQWRHKSGKEHWRERGFLSLPAEIFIYMWHLSAIASRLAAYATFVTVYQQYLWILIGVRWLLNTALIKADSWDISLTRCIAFGGVCLFSFVSTSPKPQVLRILLHYAITMTENIIIAVLISKSLTNNPYMPGMYGFIFGGAFLSFLFMSAYYRFFHPRKTQLKMIEWYRSRKTAAV